MISAEHTDVPKLYKIQISDMHGGFLSLNATFFLAVCQRRSKLEKNAGSSSGTGPVGEERELLIFKMYTAVVYAADEQSALRVRSPHNCTKRGRKT